MLDHLASIWQPPSPGIKITGRPCATASVEKIAMLVIIISPILGSEDWGGLQKNEECHLFKSEEEQKPNHYYSFFFYKSILDI